MLLSVEDVAKTFLLKQGWPNTKLVEVKALDGVSFHVDKGESLGVVGESGCGKSTAARVALRLIGADRGRVMFDGKDILKAPPAEMRALRRRMQIVFQDPASALDPRQRVGAALIEPLGVHGLASGARARDKAAAILDEVGLPPSALDRYPHEFSGGQRQRIGVARALALEPDVIFADEPVSALDVSVQAQILKLLADLKKRRNLAFVFISHDLGVVRYFCERTVVMYLGRVIESGPTGQIFDSPKHPYTQLLRKASPVPDPTAPTPDIPLDGEPPSPVAPPPGCHFHPRCPIATDICRKERPLLRELAPARMAACHHAT